MTYFIPLQFRQIRSRRFGNGHVYMHVYDAGNKQEEKPRNQHQRFHKHRKAVELVIDLQIKHPKTAM